MRSLAHDLGEDLECGAHVSALRRVLMGDFDIDMAHTVEELERLAAEGRLAEALLPPEQVLPEFPTHRVDATTATRISHGQDFHVSPFGNVKPSKLVKAVGPDGRLLCIGEAKLPRLYHPIVVF